MFRGDMGNYYLSTIDLAMSNFVHQTSKHPTLKKLLPVLFLFAFNSQVSAQCPTIFIDDLFGIPGYPTLNEASVCGEPDTLTYYLLNTSGQTLLNSQIELEIPQGFEYAGFYDYYDPAYPINQGSTADPNEPSFVMTNFSADSVQIFTVGVVAVCDVYELPSTATFEFDMNFNYIYNDPVLGLLSCTTTSNGDIDYSPYLKRPSLNIIANSAPNITITNNSRRCTNIRVSQNGIGASLTDFKFEIQGIDLTTNYILDRFRVDGTNVPWTYDPATMTVTADVTSGFLPGGSLTEDEYVTVQVCYMDALDCETSQAINNLTYAASFGCGGGEACVEPSTSDGTIKYAPNFGADAVIDVTQVQSPAICGDNAIFDVTVTSDVTDPLLGLFENLELGFQICEADAFDAVDVRINGVSIDPSYFYYNNFDFVVNTTLFTSDPDGPGGGLEDIDGDGFFDDLPGGNTFSLTIEAAIKCQDPQQIVGCAALDCTFEQATVRGKRHCGQDFQQLPDISPAPVFSYGADTVYVDETNIGTDNSPVFGFDFGTGVNDALTDITAT